MTLRDCETGAGKRADQDRTSLDEGERNMGEGESFTFDTENVDPAQNFHIPSMVTDRKLQRIAVKVARVHPDIVTIGDYQRIPQDHLRKILRDLGLPPRDVKSFAEVVKGVITAAE